MKSKQHYPIHYWNTSSTILHIIEMQTAQSYINLNIKSTILYITETQTTLSYILLNTNNTVLQWLQALGAQEMQWAQALEKWPWLQMYTVPGNCTPLGWQTTEGSPGRTWQAWGGSFLLLPRRHAVSSRWLWTLNHNMWKQPGRSSRTCYQFSLHATSLSKHVAVCTALVCGAQCSMPARLGHWQSQTSSNDKAMIRDLQCQAARHCHHQVQWATCAALHWGSGPHSEGEKTPMVRTCGTLQWCSQDSLWHTGWWKAWAWEAQNDMEAADREGLQRVEALGYQPSW